MSANYLMELILPKVDQLLADRARFEKYLSIDAARFFERRREDALVIDDIMYELFNRRQADYDKHYVTQIARLQQLADEPDRQRQIDGIWEVFGDRVDRASLYLYALRPDEFMFYRSMDVEPAIFESLAVLSEGFGELEFAFSGVPQSGRAVYEALNRGLQDFAARIWPDDADRSLRVMLLTYWVLPELTRPSSGVPGFWVGMAKDDAHKQEILNLRVGETTEWSATFEVEPGDLYYVYCTGSGEVPVKGIAALFRTKGRSWCDPVGGWKGHWVEIEKVADGIVTLDQMNADDLLKQWGPVRRNFQGTVLERIPPRFFKRLRELYVEMGMPPGLVEDPVLERYYEAGAFASEKDFEMQRVKPFIRELGFEGAYQHRVDFHIGSGRHECWVDFLIRDERGRDVSLFEDKKAITTDKHTTSAYLQGCSYALQMGLRSFVVSAPEGLRFYGRHRASREFPPSGEPLFEARWPEMESEAKKKELRDLLRRYAPSDD